MLLVRVRLAPSPIHGIGVFAVDPIPSGAEVWRFTPGLDLDLDPSVLDDQPTLARERLLHYGYIDPRLNRYILGCDEVRFFNHSDTPNVIPDFSRDCYGVDIAAHDIAAGEEITVNYEWVDGERPASSDAEFHRCPPPPTRHPPPGQSDDGNGMVAESW